MTKSLINTYSLFNELNNNTNYSDFSLIEGLDRILIYYDDMIKSEHAPCFEYNNLNVISQIKDK